MKYIDLIFIVTGIVFLILSIKPSFLIIKSLHKGKMRKKWYYMVVLIFFFILSYTALLFMFLYSKAYIRDNLLAVLLLAGSIFVALTCDLTLKTIKDIQKIHKLEEESIKDPLTKIYNRRYLERTLLIECDKSNRNKKPLSLLLIDLDDFKSINDKYGHKRGDDVLVKVASILLKHSRDSDFVARFGGEEMVVVISGSDKEGAYFLAERMRKEISETTIPGDKNVGDIKDITVCIGISTLKDCKSPCNLIERADKAMYLAKSTGKNKTVIDET